MFRNKNKNKKIESRRIETIPNPKHEHSWEIKWKGSSDVGWTTKFKRILYTDSIRVEIWLCVDVVCNHIDVDVYRYITKDLDDDLVDDIDKAIIKARIDLRENKSLFFEQDRKMEALRQRWENVIGENFIGNFCSNCGTHKSCLCFLDKYRDK